MGVRIRRAYEDPAPDDGDRILVDRVWPRGRTREALRIEEWARDLGPSDALRRWFGHDPTRWDEFLRRYLGELARPEAVATLERLAALAREGEITLVYGARDERRNQAVVIAGEIERRLR